ncbi:MAG: hypothetical protein B6D46_03460 [Polyangiaceae bacterium UTPRO1]|jgi:hypothetical protein|nr:hypothetical protein [Myxococcales bacterium]OQY68465.1 MAG: hypothetical protein B6D46_03460 [Polyangiaceae bacterium UTPRO1]
MTWLATTLAMYGRAFRRAGELTLRNWAVAGTTFAYAVALTAAVIVASGLGFAGGFLMSLVWAACVSSFLYLVEMMLRTGAVSFDDFRRSFGVYLWDVVGVTFILWVVFVVATPALRTLPQGPGIILAMNLVVVVLFNAVPELIYLGHYSSLALLGESYRFIADNWIEWFPATIAMAAPLVVLAGVALPGVLDLARMGLLALWVYFMMVARGLLFLELHGSTRRARDFRRRAGGL